MIFTRLISATTDEEYIDIVNSIKEYNVNVDFYILNKTNKMVANIYLQRFRSYYDPKGVAIIQQYPYDYYLYIFTCCCRGVNVLEILDIENNELVIELLMVAKNEDYCEYVHDIIKRLGHIKTAEIGHKKGLSFEEYLHSGRK